MHDLESLRRMVSDGLDLTGEISDDELYRRIDELLIRLGREEYFPLSERMYCRRALYDSFRRLDVLSEALDEMGVTEVMVNGADHIFIEKDGRIVPFHKRFTSEGKLEDVVQKIVAAVNRRVNESNPMVDARLDDGSRVNIVLPPIALDGPVITIRRFCEKPPDMEQLIAWEAVSEEAVSFLKLLVKAKYNIFISGGTGSGKTTFLGALAGFIAPDERVITIEDSAELRLVQVKNLVRLEARAASQEGTGEVSIRDLIRNSLRMRPDRIIVGEIRGKEALEMLQAMDTGHNGSMSTGHANSPEDMLSRIETMVLMGMDLPLAAIRGQIASALDIMIHLGRLRDRSRKVLSISEVSGIYEGQVKLKRLYEFQETREADGKICGRLVRCGELEHTGKLAEAGLLPA